MFLMEMTRIDGQLHEVGENAALRKHSYMSQKILMSR